MGQSAATLAWLSTHLVPLPLELFLEGLGDGGVDIAEAARGGHVLPGELGALLHHLLGLLGLCGRPGT